MKYIYHDLYEDLQLERLGNFYSSEFVKNNMPWIHKLPFHEWLEKVKEGSYLSHKEVRQINSNRY